MNLTQVSWPLNENLHKLLIFLDSNTRHIFSVLSDEINRVSITCGEWVAVLHLGLTRFIVHPLTKFDFPHFYFQNKQD